MCNWTLPLPRRLDCRWHCGYRFSMLVFPTMKLLAKRQFHSMAVMVVWVRWRMSRNTLLKEELSFLGMCFLLALEFSDPTESWGSNWLLSGECRLDVGHVWRMQAVTWLLSGECWLWRGSCLENAGCDVDHVWRVQAVTWVMSGECRLDVGHVWRMQAVTWVMSGECRLWRGSCLENAGCDLGHVWRIWRMQAVT